MGFLLKYYTNHYYSIKKVESLLYLIKIGYKRNSL